MGIIKTDKLVFEYIRRDEEGNVEGITRAVDEVDLDVKQGDFIAILGHNGSGKSTLAKHINAILYPTEGTVWVDGMDTTVSMYAEDMHSIRRFPSRLVFHLCQSSNRHFCNCRLRYRQ